ncbi:MAG: hypothetical protein ABI591_01225 [Kofleriaceae bacterium]
MGSSLWFLLLAAIVALVTGCPRVEAQPAQQLPGDAGIHIADALKRAPITRDATPLHLDGGAIHADGGPSSSH